MSGRASEYTEAEADSICVQIAMGKSLVNICKESGRDYSTVMKWLKDQPEFAKNYTAARESQADYHADEIIDIADDSLLTPDDRRVRIDARKWKAGKMKPKVYGEKIQQEHSGSIATTPIEERDKALLDDYAKAD